MKRRPTVKAGGWMRWLLVGLLAEMLMAGSTAPALAQDAKVRSSDQILGALTGESRGPKMRIKVNKDGYTVPEASDHISLNITFDLNKATLRPEAIRQLKEVARAMNAEELGDARFLIEGHTCSRGAADYNMQLSIQRAKAVEDHLIKILGISEKRIETAGFGETRPVASNADDEGRGKNRRVDFVTLESHKQPAVTRGLRSAVVMVEEAERFVNVEFYGIPKKVGREVQLTDENNVLCSGDMFQLRMAVTEGCHLYVLFKDSKGVIEWLYPTDDLAYGRWQYFGNQLTLPEDSKWFYLDENPGEETVYVIASHTPLSNPELLPQTIGKYKTDTKRMQAELGGKDVQVNCFVIEHK